MITVGLDVGGTKVLGLAVDAEHPATPLAVERVPTPEGGAGLVDALADLIEGLAAAAGPIGAVGVGVPGLVDRSGTLRIGPHLGHVVDLPLAATLRERTGHPTVVDNDANCAAVAEHGLGAAAGADEAVVVTLGTGIGAGIITGGRLLRGAQGFAGEPGHMIVDPDGPPCPCGRRGCWERYGSGTGLGRLARDAAHGGRLDAVVAQAGGDRDAVRGEHVVASARQHDPGALGLLDDFARWVALGLANLVNLLDPEVVVLGGGLVGAADLLLPRIEHHVGDLVMAPGVRRPVAIRAAALGEEAGAIGAALLAAAP